jgi:acyl carrier protein
VEKQLAAIWSEILSVNRVGIDDNFFELGGNSLSAIQVFSRVRAAFSVDIPLEALVAHPTLAKMAAAIVQCLAGRTKQRELDQVLSDLERLSEEEARRLLVKELPKGKA